jgi:hypothetical protein
VCGLKSGDVWSVRVYNAAGLDYVVHVADPALGNPRAITGHVIDPVNPPICS